MTRYLLLGVVCLSPFIVQGQSWSWGISGGRELIGDHLTAQFVLGGDLRYQFRSGFFLQTTLRYSHGTGFIGGNSSGAPSNAIGLLDFYVFESDVVYDKLAPGITGQVMSYNTDALFVFSNAYQLGYNLSFGENWNLYAAIGMSFSYMNNQSLSEEGDARFDSDSQDALLWYRAPSYIRGTGLNLAASLGIEYCVGSHNIGISLNPEFSLGFKDAIANRIPLVFTIRTNPDGDAEDNSSSDPLYIRATTQWTYLGHSKLNGIRYMAIVGFQMKGKFSLEVASGMSVVSGNRTSTYFENDLGYILADQHNRSKWYDPDGGPSGLISKDSFIGIFKLRSAMTRQFDVIPSIGYHFNKKQGRITTGMALSWIDKKYIADERLGTFTNLLDEYEDVYLTSPFYSNYFDIGWDVGVLYGWNIRNTKIGIEAHGTLMSSGDVNYSIGGFIEF